MESSDFKLEHAVNDYVLVIKKKGSLTGSDVEELKSHLYDATEDLQERGLTEEEAFIIASRRLGNINVLAKEYRKVNFTLEADKIWAYMLIGFGSLTTLQWLFTLGYRSVYKLIAAHYAHTDLGILLFTCANLLICIGIWSVLKWRKHLPDLLERNIEQRPGSTISLIFLLPVCILFLGSSYLDQPGNIPLLSYVTNIYPAQFFDHGFAEISFYLTIVSFLMVMLFLVFSIINKEKAPVMEPLRTKGLP